MRAWAIIQLIGVGIIWACAIYATVLVDRMRRRIPEWSEPQGPELVPDPAEAYLGPALKVLEDKVRRLENQRSKIQ